MISYINKVTELCFNNIHVGKHSKLQTGIRIHIRKAEEIFWKQYEATYVIIRGAAVRPQPLKRFGCVKS